MRVRKSIQSSFVGAGLIGTLVLTACSSGSSSKTKGSTGSTSSAGSISSAGTSTSAPTSGPAASSSSPAASSGSGINVAQAKASLDTAIGGSGAVSLPPVGKKIPTKKTINFITCPVAICTEVGDGVKAAAQTLGWTVKTIPNNFTPAGYLDAWNQIAQSPGNGVINSGPALPYSAIQAQLSKANVPVVSSTSPSPVGGHLIAVIASAAGIKKEGSLEADWVIQDAGKPVKSVYVYDPSIPALAEAWPGYQEEMKKNCPACSVALLKVSAAQIGPALSQQVVSYLQSNTDVKYVGFGLGDLATGVPAAIRAAGLQKQVKLLTRAATPANLGDIKSGGMAAALTSEVYESGWRTVDKLARKFAGAPIGDPYPFGLNRLITKNNLPPDITKPYTLPNYQAGFKKAWGIG